eukprot:m.219414 g.219414  ORF g.219414 m.219414 type:complete len:1082 (-) comp33292_c8_seq1:108-3353(-)
MHSQVGLLAYPSNTTTTTNDNDGENNNNTVAVTVNSSIDVDGIHTNTNSNTNTISNTNTSDHDNDNDMDSTYTNDINDEDDNQDRTDRDDHDPSDNSINDSVNNIDGHHNENNNMATIDDERGVRLRTLSNCLRILLKDAVSKGIRLSTEDAGLIMLAQLESDNNVRDALDIAHDFLLYNLVALETTVVLEVVPKLCRYAVELGQEYLDDAIDLMLLLADHTPHNVELALVQALVTRCIEAGSISRVLLTLRCAAKTNVLKDLRLFEQACMLFYKSEDIRIFTLLEIVTEARLEPSRSLIIATVNVLSVKNELTHAWDLAQVMVVGEMAPDPVSLGSLVVALAQAGGHSEQTQAVMARLFSCGQLQPTPLCLVMIANALVSTNDFETLQAIIGAAQKYDVLLSISFLNAVFASIHDAVVGVVKGKDVNRKQAESLSTKALVLFNIIKDFKLVVDHMKIAALSEATLTLNTKGTTPTPSTTTTSAAASISYINGSSSRPQCVKELSWIVDLLEMFRQQNELTMFFNVHATVIGCGFVCAKSFNEYIVNNLIINNKDDARSAIKGMCYIADSAEHPRHSVMRTGNIVKFLRTIERGGQLKSSEKYDIKPLEEVASWFEPAQLLNGADTRDKAFLIEVLVLTKRMDALYDCVVNNSYSIQLSSSTLEKIVEICINNHAVQKALDVLVVARDSDRKISKHLIDKVLTLVKDSENVKRALELYTALENDENNDSRNHDDNNSNSSPPTLKAFFSVVRLLSVQDDPHQHIVANAMFLRRLRKSDLSERILGETPLVINLVALTANEMVWTLDYYLTGRLKKMNIPKSRLHALTLHVFDGGSKDGVTDPVLLHLKTYLETLGISVTCEMKDGKIEIDVNNLAEFLFRDEKKTVVSRPKLKKLVSPPVHAQAQARPPPPKPEVPPPPPPVVVASDMTNQKQKQQLLDGDLSAPAQTIFVSEEEKQQQHGLRKLVIKNKIADLVVRHLKPHFDEKRILNKDEFKHLSRKLTRECLQDFPQYQGSEAVETISPHIKSKIDALFKTKKLYTSTSVSRKKSKGNASSTRSSSSSSPAGKSTNSAKNKSSKSKH